MSADELEVDGCVHVVRGEGSGYGLSQRVLFHDSLQLGPCHVDPVRHADLRRGFWTSVDEFLRESEPPQRETAARRRSHRTAFDAELLAETRLGERLQAFPAEAPIVLWTTPAWSDRLTLFRLADECVRASIDIDRIRIAALRPDAPDDIRTEFGMGAFRSDEFLAALPFAQRATEIELKRLALFWSAYAGPDPTAFDGARRLGSDVCPEFCRESGPYRFGFPRRDADGRLLLSELDELLLRAMSSAEGARPVDVLLMPPRTAVLLPYRDAFIGYRMAQWAKHAPHAPATVPERREGANSATRVAFRLTERGKRLLTDGLDSLDEAPPMEIGGCTAYVDPWVIEGVAGDWRIARL